MEVANQASSAATEKTEESLLPCAVVEESLLPSVVVEGSSHIGASALRVVMHIMPNTINGDTESESEYIFFMVRAHSQWLNQHVCYIRCVYTSTRSRIRILIWIAIQRWSEYNYMHGFESSLPPCKHNQSGSRSESESYFGMQIILAYYAMLQCLTDSPTLYSKKLSIMLIMYTRFLTKRFLLSTEFSA